ncbi:hypothetical protein [Deinococcus arcticus]|uniref:DUF5666 domain-containing protein n=1 Tax=Deinococcus arcticus TaxID=2136176 RepID=A0A2T3W4I7_9DEIO|nr:hypothetical protein [Deinococcus arcticus]PTA66816.1 hypothetical protein C8263_15865 [Deinococcus arcticus]
MLRSLLAASLLFLPSVAVAGSGQNAQPRAVAPFGAPRVLAANSPVKPGQTWVLSGITASGQKVSRQIVLSKKAPTWDDGWDFDGDVGPFSYNPEDGTIFAGDVMTGMMNDSDVLACFGFLKGMVGSGALLAGSLDEIDTELQKLDEDLPDPKTAAEAVATMRGAGMKVGTCTLTLKK